MLHPLKDPKSIITREKRFSKLIPVSIHHRIIDILKPRDKFKIMEPLIDRQCQNTSSFLQKSNCCLCKVDLLNSILHASFEVAKYFINPAGIQTGYKIRSLCRTMATYLGSKHTIWRFCLCKYQNEILTVPYKICTQLLKQTITTEHFMSKPFACKHTAARRNGFPQCLSKTSQQNYET